MRQNGEMMKRRCFTRTIYEDYTKKTRKGQSLEEIWGAARCLWSRVRKSIDATKNWRQAQVGWRGCPGLRADGNY